MILDIVESKSTANQNGSSKYLNIFIGLYLNRLMIKMPLLAFNKA